MISAESYTIAWIDQVVQKCKINSYDLTEKMIYDFTLADQLRLKKLDFIFKGGTALSLMLDDFHRLSKDIDILIPQKPENLNSIFDEIITDSPFVKWEASERKNDGFSVPKEHYKFFYKQSKPSKYPEQPVLLDILYVPNTYPTTQRLPVQSLVLSSSAPYEEIVLPSLNSITGDKLTAFAPNTIGIPHSKSKEIEMAKQLFDLSALFERITNLGEVMASFERTADMVTRHYRKDFTPEHIYEDIIYTSLVMALGGKENFALFGEIRKGVAGLKTYLSNDAPFGWDKAVLASAKVTYLAACLKKGKPLELISGNMFSADELKKMKIDNPVYSQFNKALKAGYTEAWLYWYHTSKLLTV